jgi:predicted ATPase
MDNPTQDQIEDYGLYLIDKILFHAGVFEGVKQYIGMPAPNYELWSQIEGNRLVAEQLDFNAEEHQQKANANIEKLNTGQKHAFDKVMVAVIENKPKMFFLHGPAGTGKTFTYNTLCYMLRGQKKIILCCASSGIAALLLPKGHTSHSTFKIPIDIYEDKLCSIKKNSDLAELLQQTALIIWDEVPMQN